MSRLTIVATLLLLPTILMAQNFKFHKDGTFKIAQITDVHYNDEFPETHPFSIALMREIAENEKPDLVIMTGDIVTSHNSDKNPNNIEESWNALLAPFQEAGIAVGIVLGNHDDEQEANRDVIYSYLKNQPLCYADADDLVLEIKGKSDKTEALIYLIDSKAYSTVEGIPGYGWIEPSQIANYSRVSAEYTKANEGTPLPALAYFHIPLPEYTEAYLYGTPRYFGSRGEAECSPKINTGMFAAMRIAGDVMGCFVGHDHINDYVAYHHGIALCYGRQSSEKATYGYLTSGSRIVVLYEGKREWDSYIYEIGGRITQRSHYPAKK